MVHFAVMSRRLLAPALLAVWGMASQAGPTFASGESAEPQQLPYQGRHGDTNWPQMVRQRVAPLLPQALFRASDLLGDEVDTNRVDVRLMDIIPRDKSFISSMYTYGYGRPTLGIPIEPLIRGEFQDEEDLLATMTHELIHVYMRQHLQQEEYNAIPEWFQEGMPTFLCGQLSGKLGSALALNWDNPSAVLAGFWGDHADQPYITGAFFCAELEERLGRKGLQDFIGTLAAGGGLEAGFAGLPFGERETWQGARVRAAETVETVSAGLADDLRECRAFYEGGKDYRQEALSCFEALMADHPGTYAGEIAHYWAAKCHYHRGEARQANALFDRFLGFRETYGLLDNVFYYKIRLAMITGDNTKVADLCSFYLAFFPEGDNRAKVEHYCGNAGTPDRSERD